MRIAIVSLDTRGGVQPYVALALGLVKAGHTVRMLSTEDFAPMFRAHGLEAVSLSGDLESFLRTSSGGAAEKGSLATMRFAYRELSKRVLTWTREALAGCAGVDVISGGVGGMVVGVSIAEKLGVPFIEAHLHPLGPPTAAFPGVLLPGVPAWLGAHVRRWTHTLSDVVLWAPFNAVMKRARREVLGLPERAPRVTRSDTPVLYGFSPQVIPRPPEWEARRHITGYWTLPAGPDWKPPPDLEAFVDSGPAPVCIGFGSMTSHDAQATAELVVAAVKRAGVRAVLLSGWGGLEAASRDSVHVMSAAPHDWLFPRMAGVVHHGGAGTTGAALRAGVPALVVPFMMDQPFWAARVAALGAGPQPIARKRLTVDELAASLRLLTSDEAMRARAARLGEKLRAEDGVGEAVRHFDAFFARRA